MLCLSFKSLLSKHTQLYLQVYLLRYFLNQIYGAITIRGRNLKYMCMCAYLCMRKDSLDLPRKIL